ncbi:hypothetical protein PENSPDRAFT_649856 [Peniophora sp. CONT]|nr:hypothetical protein PENSPDRAFT_649856 [Peniophora sp. CONT]
MPPPDEYAPYVARSPNIRTETYAEAAATVCISLMQDAAKSVSILRNMFEEQRSCPIEPFAGPDTTVEELVFSFAFWIDALREVLRSCSEQELEPQVVGGIAESGLLDLYQDIILWPGFFSQHQRFTDDVIKGYMALILLVSGHLESLLPGLILRAPKLWAHIWRHRAKFTLWDSSATTMIVRNADVKPRGTPALHLLLLYQELCGPLVSNATHIPCVILYSWTVYDGPPEQLLHLELEDVVANLRSGLDMDRRSRATEVDRILREAIIARVGLDALFTKFKRVLQDVHASLNIELFTICVRLLELVSAGHTINTVPHFSRHEIMRLVVATVMDSRLEDGVAMSGIHYSDVFPLFRTTQRSHVKSENAVMRGEDVVAFLSSCLDAIVAKDRMIALPDSFEDDVLQSVQKYRQLTKDPVELSSRTLVQGMQIGAFGYWWPTLARLSENRSSSIADHANIQRLKDAWEDLGKALDLDVQQEHQRHEEETRSGCSWRNCPRRGQSVIGATEPSTSRCSGCRETRYCSTECQKRDWKHGRHKAHCGKKRKV